MFGHFTYYHLAMVTLFALAGFSIAISRVMESYKNGHIILASVGSMIWGFWIEDMAYFAQRHPEDLLGPASWVNWILSGHYLLGHWIPTIYYVMALAGFMLYAAAFVRSRKDSITVMARPMLTGRADPLSPFRSMSSLGETAGYLRSILPFAVVIVPVAIVASASKDCVGLPCSLARIAAVWLITFIPSIAMFFASNRRYLNSFLEDQFKPLVFGEDRQKGHNKSLLCYLPHRPKVGYNDTGFRTPQNITFFKPSSMMESSMVIVFRVTAF